MFPALWDVWCQVAKAFRNGPGLAVSQREGSLRKPVAKGGKIQSSIPSQNERLEGDGQKHTPHQHKHPLS